MIPKGNQNHIKLRPGVNSGSQEEPFHKHSELLDLNVKDHGLRPNSIKIYFKIGI